MNGGIRAAREYLIVMLTTHAEDRNPSHAALHVIPLAQRTAQFCKSPQQLAMK
jgi:hypothetical protein